MLFQASDGGWYSVASVTRVSQPHNGVVTITLNEERQVQLSERLLQSALLRLPVQTFPALPDTYVVRADTESPDGHWRMQVVGWAFCVGGEFLPITVDGVNDGMDHTLNVLTPDGRVARTLEASWESVEKFLASDEAKLDA